MKQKLQNSKHLANVYIKILNIKCLLYIIAKKLHINVNHEISFYNTKDFNYCLEQNSTDMHALVAYDGVILVSLRLHTENKIYILWI